MKSVEYVPHTRSRLGAMAAYYYALCEPPCAYRCEGFFYLVRNFDFLRVRCDILFKKILQLHGCINKLKM